jgi:hypothetical protein
MRPRTLLAIAALISLAAPAPSHALPAFARRFNLACGACHTAVPRLNAFGEAFHENGFKPPGTMHAPLPDNWADGIRHSMAVWSRGEFYERPTSPRARRPRRLRPGAYQRLHGPITTTTSLFIELEHERHEVDINKNGDFVTSNGGGMQRPSRSTCPCLRPA